MSDFAIIDGDQAVFLPAFGMAIVVVQPGTISGSGPATWKGAPLCIEGDEASVEVPGCTYTAGPYCVPGTGTLKIDALGSDQIASKTQTGATPLILKGSMFTALFEVQSPAQQPTPTGPVPDSMSKYNGQGMFTTTNTHYKGV